MGLGPAWGVGHGLGTCVGCGPWAWDLRGVWAMGLGPAWGVVKQNDFTHSLEIGYAIQNIHSAPDVLNREPVQFIKCLGETYKEWCPVFAIFYSGCILSPVCTEHT